MITANKYFSISFIVVLFYYSLAYTESRDTIRQNEINKDLKNSATIDFSKEKTKNSLIPSEDSIGLMRINIGSEKDFSALDLLVDAVTSKDKFRYRLTMKITCSDDNSVFQTPVKNQIIKWTIKFDSDNNFKGEFQVNRDGLATILFDAPSVIIDQNINLHIKNQSKTVSLKNGPFDIHFPEEVCKNQNKKQ